MFIQISSHQSRSWIPTKKIQIAICISIIWKESHVEAVTHWQQFQTIWHTIAEEKARHMYPPINVRFNKADHYDFSFCLFFQSLQQFSCVNILAQRCPFATIGVADQSCRVYNLNLQILFCRFCSSFGAHCLNCRKMIRCAFLYCSM